MMCISIYIHVLHIHAQIYGICSSPEVGIDMGSLGPYEKPSSFFLDSSAEKTAMVGFHGRIFLWREFQPSPVMVGLWHWVSNINACIYT